MSETTFSTLPDPSGFSPDPLTDLIREGARKLIEQAVEAELATFLAAFAKDRLDDGRAMLVRHGHLPEREILTGIGPFTFQTRHHFVERDVFLRFDHAGNERFMRVQP